MGNYNYTCNRYFSIGLFNMILEQMVDRYREYMKSKLLVYNTAKLAGYTSVAKLCADFLLSSLKNKNVTKQHM